MWFKRIKQKLLSRNKFTNYLTYALGEVLLIGFGIVLGVKANNWSERQNKADKINDYYHRILDEVDLSMQVAEHNNLVVDSMLNGLLACQKAFYLKHEDSMFFENFKIVFSTQTQSYFFPIIDEFLSLGYLSTISEPVLQEKFQLLDYIRSQIKLHDKNIIDYENNVLKPQLISKLDYAKSVEKNQSRALQLNKDSLNRFPLVFDSMVQDITILNIINHRITAEEYRLHFNKGLLNILKGMKAKLEEEIAKR
ncbi:MAG: hypothetical protein H6607_13500 [Flavobacteriales bacterium]|nr:hypothetical protein [Flavobacteriales bacterium]